MKKKNYCYKKEIKKNVSISTYFSIYIYRQEFIFSLGKNVKIKIIIQRKFFPIKTNENFN